MIELSSFGAHNLENRQSFVGLGFVGWDMGSGVCDLRIAMLVVKSSDTLFEEKNSSSEEVLVDGVGPAPLRKILGGANPPSRSLPAAEGG